MSQPIRGHGGHLVFPIDRKTQTWYRTLRSCFLSSFLEFRSAVSEEKSKMSQPIRGQGGHLVFPIDPKNTLGSCFLSSFVEFRSTVSEEKSKMSQPIIGQGGHLVFFFSIDRKNTNLVEDDEFLLPVKFR